MKARAPAEPASFTMNGRPKETGIEHVAVVGGAGYVGSVLIRRLLERGYRVTTLDALVYGDDGIRDLYGHDGFAVVEGDLRSVEAIVRACRAADAVVHLGGLVGDPACALDEKVTVAINQEATQTLADVARGLDMKRFIFASSCAIYGQGNEILNERSPVSPVSLYARTKIDSEILLLTVNDDRFAPVVLRFGTLYGMSPRARFDLVVNVLVAKALAEGQITIMGPGQWRPFLHVEDSAEAVVRSLEAPLDIVKGEIFNVGADAENYTFGQVAELIAEAIPGTLINYEGSGKEANYRVSFEKIRTELGFAPRHSVMDGILELKTAIEAKTIADYRDDRHSNHKSLLNGAAAAILNGVANR